MSDRNVYSYSRHSIPLPIYNEYMEMAHTGQKLHHVMRDLLDNYNKQGDTIARLAEENQKQRHEIEVLEATLTVYKNKGVI